MSSPENRQTPEKPFEKPVHYFREGKVVSPEALLKISRESGGLVGAGEQGLCYLETALTLRDLLGENKGVLPCIAISPDKAALLRFVGRMILSNRDLSEIYLAAPKESVSDVPSDEQKPAWGDLIFQKKKDSVFRSKVLNRLGYCTIQQLLDAHEPPVGIDEWVWQCAQTFKREKQTIADIAKS